MEGVPAWDMETLTEALPAVSPGHAWLVHKFGGTCVGTPERILNAARIIAAEADAERKEKEEDGEGGPADDSSAAASEGTGSGGVEGDKGRENEGKGGGLEEGGGGETQEQEQEGKAGAGARKRLVVVSAMGGVTNALFGIVAQAEKGDGGFKHGLAQLRAKHRDTADALLGPGGLGSRGRGGLGERQGEKTGDSEGSAGALEAFKAELDSDLENLQAMLKAIFIVRHATESFTDFVVGHGELWSARLLSSTIAQVSGAPCAFLDARDALVVAVSGKQVDPLYRESHARLSAWYKAQGNNNTPAQGPAPVGATGDTLAEASPAPPAQADAKAEAQEGEGREGDEEVKEGEKEGAGAGEGEQDWGPGVVVATGFIARNPDGVPTTLQRDGSDFSATVFGALLGAESVTIWTDVDGVYSADPRQVAGAGVLGTMSYQEAWEMSYFGANVLHPRTTVPVMRLRIPILIRNAFNPSAPGTRICSLPLSPPPPSPSPSPTTSLAPGLQAVSCGPQQEAAAVAAPLPNGAVTEASKERGGKGGMASKRGSGRVPRGVVTGFATVHNVAIINVEGTGMAGVPGTASRIFSAVRDVGANVIAISQASSEHSVCFAVPQGEAPAVVGALQRVFAAALSQGHISRVDAVAPCCVMAAVGQRMASTPGVSAALFGALSGAGVNVRGIAQGCSEFNITVMLDQADALPALSAAHARFFGAPTRLALGLVGPGLIGATVLAQLRKQAPVLLRDLGLEIRVVGICTSTAMLLRPEGVDLSRWKEEMKEDALPVDLTAFAGFVAGAREASGAAPPSSSSSSSSSSMGQETPGPHDKPNQNKGGSPKSQPGQQRHWFANAAMLDCTASEIVGGLYEQWLVQGLHVVTPNKKTGSGPLSTYRRVMATQRECGRRFLYEATVGAGLPLMNTVQSLRDSGDRVERIEGVFSGTLSFLFNTYDATQPFSKVVIDAKDAGYTEPDPRDDLNGMDVARKVVILAREAGLDLELEDVSVQSLVPKELQSVASVNEFLDRLPDYDQMMEDMYRKAKAEDKVLRYVGSVDLNSLAASVHLEHCPASHPFAKLSGSDNIVAFQTRRYSPQPLVIRGPGAGAEVTAGGVFADLLRLSSYLGAQC